MAYGIIFREYRALYFVKQTINNIAISTNIDSVDRLNNPVSLEQSSSLKANGCSDFKKFLLLT